MAERPFQPVPNTPLVADPTGDAIWKRWLQGLQAFLGRAVRGPTSSTDNAVARWDGTSGQFLNNSGVIIDDSNNVTGIEDLTVNGDTTLGNASGDTLTINAGTWTYGNKYTATLTAGAQGAGVTNLQALVATFSGDAGGTSNIRAVREDYTSSGANPILVVTGRHLVSIYNGSGGLDSHVATLSEARVTGSGNVVTARCFLTGATVTGGSTVTTFDGYNVGTTTITSGAITTLNGFKISDIGNANATNAIGIKIDNITASTTIRGIQSSVNSGAGKHNLYIDGTANNSFAGPIYAAQDNKTIQTASAIYAGTGAPNNANGNNGDFYFRGDGGVLTTIYQRRAGAWVGVV